MTEEPPLFDPCSWTLDQMHSFITSSSGEVLETARVAAQGHAYDRDRPREDRLRWAKLSLLANRGLRDGTETSRIRVAHQEFMLRMWVIEQLGPDDTDPDWSPEALAADTLDALTLTPARAVELADGRRDLPVGDILVLRWHKNLTAHLRWLIDHLAPGPVREALVTWAGTRPLLP
ncbi:hypothetical protein AQJ30_33695 [Streptomyces longwoodensis]|uniref:Uncharacterized protein n=2 Tax=Streptomyces longwoodensis TaxID=68231 RepID=A0A124HPV7_9ACTN|nr:hypothetical protein AQJ30_33695 [Streptomyces longwoodensis]